MENNNLNEELSIDTVAPNSTVEILPDSVTNDFTVTWYGLDNEGGSGVASYDVFVSTDGGEFELWQNDTAAVSGLYNGESDRSYGFYSVAADADGNTEVAANEIQAVTTTNGNNQQPIIYRFFNPSAGVHFYTSNVTERDSVFSTLDNYTYEGASYFGGSPEGSLPVYRLLNTNTGVHLYTIDEQERDFIQTNQPEFQFEGEVFRAYAEQIEGTIPVYRFFNPSTGTHFYTPNEGERESVEADLPAYQSEGIAYYTFPLDADSPRIAAPESSTDGFTGAEVGYQSFFPDLASPVGESLVSTVGEGAEFVIPNNEATGVVGETIDISGNSILYEVTAPAGTYTDREFNGLVLTDLSDTIPDLVGLAIDPSGTTFELDPSRLAFTEDSVSLNLAGISHEMNDTIKLDVQFADA